MDGPLPVVASRDETEGIVTEKIAKRLRRIFDPIQKDSAAFLETSGEPGGEYALFKIEVCS